MTQILTDGAAILAALGGLIIAALIMISRVHRQSAEIVEQVANTHPTNLRNDMDDIKDLIERLSRSVSNMRAVTDETRADVRETRQDIQIIRTEMRDDRASLDAERVARQDLDSKADRAHAEIFGRLNRIERRREPQ